MGFDLMDKNWHESFAKKDDWNQWVVGGCNCLWTNFGAPICKDNGLCFLASGKPEDHICRYGKKRYFPKTWGHKDIWDLI